MPLGDGTVRSSAACAQAAAGSASAASGRGESDGGAPCSRQRALPVPVDERDDAEHDARSRRRRARRSRASMLPPPPPNELGSSPRSSAPAYPSSPARSSRRPSRPSTSAGRRTCTSCSSRLAPRNGNAGGLARSGCSPPVQVTFVITASSPSPVCCTSRFQPGDGMNESIEKPSGGVSSTLVVVASSFSVGTASVNTWLSAGGTIGGLTCACADAAARHDEAADRHQREVEQDVSFDLQGEGSCEHATVCAGLQEQAPRPGDGDEHADAKLSRRRRGALDLRARRGCSCIRWRRARKRACGSSRAIRCGRRSRARARRTTA